MAKNKAYKKLRTSLMDDLEARGLVEDVYIDKVNEYMDLWERRQQLKKDIAERGIMVEDLQGRVTENRSVSLEIQVSRQMLSIFTALGFKESAASSKRIAGIEDEL